MKEHGLGINSDMLNEYMMITAEKSLNNSNYIEIFKFIIENGADVNLLTDEMILTFDDSNLLELLI